MSIGVNVWILNIIGSLANLTKLVQLIELEEQLPCLLAQSSKEQNSHLKEQNERGKCISQKC